MKQWIFAGCLVAGAISCQKAPEAKSSHALTVNLRDEPESLDPRRARSLGASTVLRMLFEGLTRVSAAGSVELALAKTYDVSEDGCMYTFSLRDALWSNGDPVTSSDFAHSWKTLLDPAYPSDVASQLFVIKGARRAKRGEIGLDAIGVHTPDEKTLVVELSQPTPYFLDLLASPSLFPVCRKVDLQNPHWANSAAAYVSNGPFILSSWRHSERIEAAKNPLYWDKESVRLDGLELVMVAPDTELAMFRQGLLGWAGSPLSTIPADALSSLKQEGSLRISPLTGTFFLRVNTLHASPLASPIFRKALAVAINRSDIVEHVLQGGQLAATALVPPLMGLSSDGYFADGDADEAKGLLASLQEEVPRLSLLYVGSDRNHAIAQVLQEQLKKTLGIPLKLEAVEGKSFYERISRKDYQLALGSWIADFNDPINFLDLFKLRETGTNNTGWEDPSYREYLDLSARSTDPEVRLDLLRQAEAVLMDEMPVIPLFHTAANYACSPRVKDVVLSPIGQIDFRRAEVRQ